MRSSPTPAAPAASPRRVSTAEATLHSTTTWCPSAVRGGSARPLVVGDLPGTPATPDAGRALRVGNFFFSPPSLALATSSALADHELAGIGVEDGGQAG